MQVTTHTDLLSHSNDDGGNGWSPQSWTLKKTRICCFYKQTMVIVRRKKKNYDTVSNLNKIDLKIFIIYIIKNNFFYRIKPLQQLKLKDQKLKAVETESEREQC